MAQGARETDGAERTQGAGAAQGAGGARGAVSGQGRARRKNRNVSLTDGELAELREALAQGRNPTVYMREAIAGLGVPAGASAKVQSIDGTSVVVKPRRVDDALPFEADELRMTKQPPPEPAVPPAKRKTATKPGAKGGPAASGKSAESGKSVTGKPQQGAARAASSRDGATITIEGRAEADGTNTWTVTVAGGGSRSAKPVAVGADAVVAAVSELGVPRAVKAVDTVVVAAREQAERRVEELSRELAEAKKALRSLKK